jgi:two-component system alkaline phosphatase synthesis response regulator PhoP/two-component system response regulator VicR
MVSASARVAAPPRHILVVDDETFIRRLVEVNLTRGGYRVSQAFDGRDALEKMESERPDMIVLDWMMPRMDGFALLVHLKKDPKTAEIPILMLTAKAQDADIFQGWASGVDGYLTKPFNPMELMTFVRRTFDSYQQPQESGGHRIII